MDIPSIGSATPPGLIAVDKNTATPGTASPVSNTNTAQSSAPAVTSETETKKPTDPSQLNKAIGDINKTLQDRGQDVRFSVDQSSKRVVVKIVDQSTNKVLRQIPTEQALEISQSLDKLQGLLIKQEA
ncbi:flagellar protein FlaG [Undibacterium jejuense]|uniref:Flagellar protein FlaG n=1 Tax=Undibacterium jejuense TaxID=1344949 RepID=A0A923HDH4_9BURK|nr:flagellar protein FlaG [Undibacterium jejuense]MBC3861744.1 flagellar protein FlaG [Undibacterium jejuense]